MVFSSVPFFLDPPNWQQPPNDETQRAAQAIPAVAEAATSSMTERERVAKIPAPEGPLKCPRCDSSNTKFCYFNNYSLTQPRHFCKTCRRYWTRGGSLRNVPVGGGCRHNKRKRASSSARHPRSPPSAAPAELPVSVEFMAAALPAQPFSFMASLQSLMMSQVGMGSYGGGNNNNNNINSCSHHQELLPNLLGGFGSSSSSMMYPFQNNNNDSNSNMEGLILETASFGKGLLGVPQHHHNHLQAPVKMDEMGGSRVNLMSKQFARDEAGPEFNQQQQQLIWRGSNGSSGGLWADVSGISSSSTTPSLNTIMR